MESTAHIRPADADSAAPVREPNDPHESALLARCPQPAPSGCGGAGEGWAAGPSRRDAQRPSGDPPQPERWPRVGADTAARDALRTGGAPRRSSTCARGPRPAPTSVTVSGAAPSTTRASRRTARRRLPHCSIVSRSKRRASRATLGQHEVRQRPSATVCPQSPTGPLTCRNTVQPAAVKHGHSSSSRSPEAGLRTWGLSLLLCCQPAVHVLPPVHDAAAQTEAVRPDAKMAPVAQRRHRGAEHRCCFRQSQQLSCRVDVLVGHDRYLRAGDDSMGINEPATSSTVCSYGHRSRPQTPGHFSGFPRWSSAGQRLPDVPAASPPSCGGPPTTTAIRARPGSDMGHGPLAAP